MKILIRATNWVGDAIMSLPAIRAVRTKFPDAEISILGRSYVVDLYREQGIADKLISHDSSGEHAGFSGTEKLAAQLRAEKYDIALLLQNAFGAAWLAWRAGIPERIGYNRDGRGLLLTNAVKTPRSGEIPAHEKYYYLELLRRAGWIDSLPDVEFVSLNVSEVARQRGAEVLLDAGARPHAMRIAVGAGASYGSAKCWPPERFTRALNLLVAQSDVDIIFFGTAAEAPVTTAIIAGLKRSPIDLTGKTPIGELPGVLSQCHLFLGNDSGAMHVAAAVGLPVVAIFGPTDPLGTAPVTLKRSVVQQKPYCSPCFLRRCPTDHRCMVAVTPEMAAEQLGFWMREVQLA